MKLVFEKFEAPLSLRRDALNVLRVEDPSLFSRCALSLAQGFPPDALEPVFFFSDDGREIKASKILYFAGDLLSLDLNDRRIVAQAIKVVAERMALEENAGYALEIINCEMEDIFAEQFVQMSANYYLADDWDLSKYLKMLGFGVDDSEDRTVYEKLQHFLRISADLFPEKVIAIVNASNYLTDAQYNEFCELVASLQLCVLSYEQGLRVAAGHLENVLSIDINYLEK